MSTSTLILYKSSIDPTKNFIIEDIGQYLASCDKVTINNFIFVKDISELEFTLKVVANQNYVQPDIDQTNLNIYQMANYAKIIMNSKAMYYFITNKSWKSTSTIEYTFRLDSLNTYMLSNGEDFNSNILALTSSFSRLHKDRFSSKGVSGTNTRLLRNIDFYNENLGLSVYKKDTTDIYTNDCPYIGIKWYLIYLTLYDTTDDYGNLVINDTNPVKLIYCASNYTGNITINGSVMGSIESINRSNPRLLKIIRIPYPPEFLRGSSPVFTSTSTDWGWTYLNGATTGDKYRVYNNTYLNEAIKTDMYLAPTTNSPLRDIIKEVTTSNITLRQSYGFLGDDSKLFHSQFSYNSFFYDSFSIQFPLESYDTSQVVMPNYPAFGLYYCLSKNVGTDMMFLFSSWIEKTNAFTSTQNFPKVLSIKRNNEVAIYNSAYLNYLKNGYNYDQKAMKNTQLASMAGMILSMTAIVAGAVVSATGGGAPLGVGMIISGVAGIAGTGVSSMFQKISQQNSIDQKIQQAETQAVSVSGSDDSDLLESYGGNVLKESYYSVSDTMRALLNRLFFYYGYATNQYWDGDDTIFNSRLRFNYVQGNIEINYQYANLFNLASHIDDIKQKFSSGVTILHHTTDTLYPWDFWQGYENYETDLFTF